MMSLHIFWAFIILLVQPGAAKKNCETSFSGIHLAHAVSGGPYFATDMSKKGTAEVDLDGSGSHSHATEGGIGEIILYTWTWKDASRKSADPSGIVTVKGEKVTETFPVGQTKVSLRVDDNFENCAVQTTTVTVSPSIKSGVYCYYHNFGYDTLNSVPLPASVKTPPLPHFAAPSKQINFPPFPQFSFKINAVVIRCTFFVAAAKTPLVVQHDGPLKVYHGVEPVLEKTGYGIKSSLIPAGTYPFGLQILYVKKFNSSGLLKLTSGNSVVTSNLFTYDSPTVLPVITSLSKKSAFAGEIISISGSGFGKSAVFKFGNDKATLVSASSSSFGVTVPPQTGPSIVAVTVTVQGSSTSNAIIFTYKTVDKSCQAPKFTPTSLLNAKGQPYLMKDVAVVRVGPDGRLYAGTQTGLIHALTFDHNLKVTKTCTKNVQGNGPRRWILGIAFNPKSTQLKMYFTSSTLFFKKNWMPWNNGKIQFITLAGPNACFDKSIKDLVVGLPVSAHDHGVNFLQFLPTGELLVSVASSTNGGISVEGDGLGGAPDSIISGAILQCPSTGYNVIKYSTPNNPATAKVLSGGCKVYAAGFRNSYGAELHTNGNLYATDNSGNEFFGFVATDCVGGKAPPKDNPDKLIQVKPNSCHGHPNLPRGLAGDPNQCVADNPKCTAPLVKNLNPSTNGVLEYRSNLFDGALKGNLFLSRFSNTVGKFGSIARVVLEGSGKSPEVTTNFASDSGLTIVEGPRGEMIMGRVYRNSFYVLKPTCDSLPSTVYLIGVHPKRGPASGGHRVLISGFNFGSSPKAFFGTRPCKNPKAVNDGAFMCTTPKGEPNLQVAVSVVVGSTTSQSTTNDYWYW